jgi:hypothetical protein
MSVKTREGQRRLIQSARVEGCKLLPTLAVAVSMTMALPVGAVGINSIHVDREGERIIVRGVDLDLATTVTLGGVTVPTANVTTSELDIPFGTEVYSAVQWEASYNLVIDGTEHLSVYIGAPIVAPPTPPPEPPPGGPDCPCITGWEESDIPKDNFSWCYYGQDGNQLWIFAIREQWTISAAFDPSDLYFDPVEPGNSVSYCVLMDSGSYTVAEPVVNSDQYSNCEDWMWINICL